MPAKYPTAKSLGLDLPSLSVFQLDSLISEAHAALKVRRVKEQKKDRKSAEQQILKLVKSAGLDLASFSNLPENSGADSADEALKGVRPSKYRNPVNAQETWSGHGQKPEWVLTFLSNGGRLENTLITKS